MVAVPQDLLDLIGQIRRSFWELKAVSDRIVADLGLTAATLIAGLLIHWAWRTVAEQVFAAPAIGYVDILAALLAASAVAAVLAMAWRLPGKKDDELARSRFYSVPV